MRTLLPILTGVLLLTSCTDSLCCRTEKPLAQTYLHKYGQEMSEAEWRRRGGFGTIQTRFENGVVRSEQYEQQQLHGEVTETFPFSSNIARREVFDRGQKVEEVLYASTGIPAQKHNWQGDQHTVTYWYGDGSPLAVETYEQGKLVSGEYFSRQHELSAQVMEGRGLRERRDAHGQLLAVEEIEMGEVCKRTDLYPEGTPRKITPMAQGRVHGVVSYFLPNGQPERTEEFHTGQLHGLVTTYLNGEKARETPYYLGLKEGVERHYVDGKQVVRTVSWAQDVRHGPSETMLPEARRIQYWYRGTEVPKFTYERQLSKERVRPLPQEEIQEHNS